MQRALKFVYLSPVLVPPPFSNGNTQEGSGMVQNGTERDAKGGVGMQFGPELMNGAVLLLSWKRKEEKIIAI